MPTTIQPPTTGARITIRGEDFLVHEVKSYADDRYLIAGRASANWCAATTTLSIPRLDDYEVLAPSTPSSWPIPTVATAN